MFKLNRLAQMTMSHNVRVREVARAIFRNKVVALKREMEDYKVDKKMKWDKPKMLLTKESSGRSWLKENLMGLIP